MPMFRLLPYYLSPGFAQVKQLEMHEVISK